MSLISLTGATTLNAADLMQQVRDKLSPELDKITDEADKALATIHAESAAWMAMVSAQLSQYHATLKEVADPLSGLLGGGQLEVSFADGKAILKFVPKEKQNDSQQSLDFAGNKPTSA